MRLLRKRRQFGMEEVEWVVDEEEVVVEEEEEVEMVNVNLRSLDGNLTEVQATPLNRELSLAKRSMRACCQ